MKNEKYGEKKNNLASGLILISIYLFFATIIASSSLAKPVYTKKDVYEVFEKAKLTVTPHTSLSPINHHKQEINVCNNQLQDVFLFLDASFGEDLREDFIKFYSFEKITFNDTVKEETNCKETTLINGSVITTCDSYFRNYSWQQELPVPLKPSFKAMGLLSKTPHYFVNGKKLAGNTCKNFKVEYKPQKKSGKWNLRVWANTKDDWKCINDRTCVYDYTLDPLYNTTCGERRNITINNKGLTQTVNITAIGNALFDPSTNFNESNFSFTNAADDTTLNWFLQYVNDSGSNNQIANFMVNVSDAGGSFWMYSNCSFNTPTEDRTTSTSSPVMIAYWNFIDGLQGWTNQGTATCSRVVNTGKAIHGGRRDSYGLNATYDIHGNGCISPSFTIDSSLRPNIRLEVLADADPSTNAIRTCSDGAPGCDVNNNQFHSEISGGGSDYWRMDDGGGWQTIHSFKADEVDFNMNQERLMLWADFSQADPTAYFYVNGTFVKSIAGAWRNGGAGLSNIKFGGDNTQKSGITEVMVWIFDNSTSLTFGSVESLISPEGFGITLNEPINDVVINSSGTITLSLNFTITGSFNNYNATVHINGTPQPGITNVINNSKYSFNVSLGLGGYNWSVNASAGSTINSTTNESFTIQQPPINFFVTLQQPVNNSELKGSQKYSFNFTITGNLGLYNATLHINSTPVQTINDVPNNTIFGINYTPVIADGYNWSVTAEGGGITNSSGNFTFNVTPLGFSINLLEPLNNTVLDNNAFEGQQNFSLNFTIIGAFNVYNASLKINDTFLASANDVLNNSKYSFNVTLKEGIYNWSVNASADGGEKNESTTLFFNVSQPNTFSITLNEPLNQSTLFGDKQVYSHNFTIIGEFAEYNASLQVDNTIIKTSVILNNSKTSLNFTPTIGNHSWFVNASAGSTTNTSNTFNYIVAHTFSLENVLFNTSGRETQEQPFVINVSFNGSVVKTARCSLFYESVGFVNCSVQKRLLNGTGFNQTVFVAEPSLPIIDVNNTGFFAQFNISFERFNGIVDNLTALNVTSHNVTFAFNIEEFVFNTTIDETALHNFSFNISTYYDLIQTNLTLTYNNSFVKGITRIMNNTDFTKTLIHLSGFNTTIANVTFRLPLIFNNNTNQNFVLEITRLYANGTIKRTNFTKTQTLLRSYFAENVYATTPNIVEGQEITIRTNLTRKQNTSTIVPQIEHDGKNVSTFVVFSNETLLIGEANVTAPIVSADSVISLVSFWSVTNNPTINLSTKGNYSVTNIDVDDCGTLNNTVLNFTYKNLETHSLINASAFYVLRIWHSDPSTKQNFTVGIFGKTSHNICVSPKGSYFADLEFLANASGFVEKTQAAQNITLNTSIIKNETIFMIASTPEDILKNITITVIDQDENPLVEHLVEAEIYNFSTDTFTLVQSQITDFDGEVLMPLIAGENQYRFNIKKDNKLLLQSIKFSLDKDSYTFKIPLVKLTVLQDLQQFNCEKFVCDIVFNNITKLVTANWSDQKNLSSKVCLKIVKLDVNGTQQVLNVCSNNQTGAFTENITALAGNGTFTISLVGFSKTSNGGFLLKTIEVFEGIIHPFKTEGLLLGFFIILLIAGMAFSGNPALIVAATIFSFAVAIIGKLFVVSLGVMVGLIFAGAIIAYKSRI